MYLARLRFTHFARGPSHVARLAVSPSRDERERCEKASRRGHRKGTRRSFGATPSGHHRVLGPTVEGDRFAAFVASVPNPSGKARVPPSTREASLALKVVRFGIPTTGAPVVLVRGRGERWRVMTVRPRCPRCILFVREGGRPRLRSAQDVDGSWTREGVPLLRTWYFEAKWAQPDLNRRPPGYQPGAPAKLSYGPITMGLKGASDRR